MIETVEKTADEKKEKSDFIKHLESLVKNKNRAALAHLRSGLRRKDSRSMEMYPVIGRFLPEKPRRNYENAVFIVAALFAYYPDAKTNIGNLGASLRQLKDDSDSIEKRFVALLNAETDELPDYLRQIIGLLKSNEVAVNWQKLFENIQNWNSDNRRVQNDWARSFWGNFNNDNNQNSQEENRGEEK